MKTPFTNSDTIVAIATPPGRGALAVVRVSGGAVTEILRQVVTWTGNDTPPKPRQQQLGHVVDEKGQFLDQVLWTYYAQPHSYTGEDVAEISCHGSPVIANEIVRLCTGAGARPAQPGEFTMRAFFNGKMDLVQAEAVRDLIASQTRYQAEVAREQLEGLISKQVTPIRDKLVDAVSHLETRLEFVEDDVDPGSREAIWKNLDEARETLRELSDSFGVGRLLREGLTVAIAGRPNVGKSSLFNTLLRFERAIVTPIPGTTRDALREWIEVEGVPVCLVDTAGIRSSGDQLEMLGVDRTGRELKGSDLVLFVTDGSEGFLEDDQKVWDSLKGHSYIIVMNKSDLKGGAYPPEGVLSGSLGMVRVSAKTGGNIEGLVQKIGDFTGAAQAAEGGRPVVTNLRQKDCLDRAIRELEQGQTALMQGLSEEFVSEDLRRCLAALEELVGETTTNTILERIFSTFCIGK